jgi:prepilin-type N-terminal cleavage/methylation domain-containing protein
MRISTARKVPDGRVGRGFTLAELMVAATLGAIVLTGVIATNLELLRSGVRVTQYSEMSTQVRRALQQLEGDVKSAITITWNGASDITLTLPAQNGTTSQVTYAWTSATESFFRVPGASSAVTVGRLYLVRGIPLLADGSAGLTFARFDRDGAVATTDVATKRLQVSLNVVRSQSSLASTTDTAVSAIFVLRNKPTS